MHLKKDLIEISLANLIVGTANILGCKSLFSPVNKCKLITE